MKPLMVTAALAIMIIVGMVAFLTGGLTGESFAISAISMPQPIYREQAFKGFEYGPMGIPFYRSSFLNAKTMCDRQNDPMMGLGFNRYECCLSMCTDACRGYSDARPGTCINTCVRGCTM